MTKTIQATDPRDFLFGASADKPTEEVTWDTSLLPPALDKKALLVSIHPDLAAHCPIAHAFCNAMEVALNEIGEASELDRMFLTTEQPQRSLADYVTQMQHCGVAHPATETPVARPTRYERLNNNHLLDDIHVALFCNIVPVISFNIGPEFSRVKNEPYIDQAAKLGGKKVNTDTYAASVLGINFPDQYIVCVSNKGYEFGVNSFFALSFDYVRQNVLDAFVIREVNGLKSSIPEELYNRTTLIGRADFAPATATHTDSVQEKRGSGWRKMLDFFTGS